MERLLAQFAAAQKEVAVMFNSAEDKRLKIMLEMEERRREADRSHEEKMMKMMLMMINPGHQQCRCNITPEMVNPSVVMPMSNITSSTPTWAMLRTWQRCWTCHIVNNAPNMTTLLNTPHSSANSYYHDQLWTIYWSHFVCILFSRI